MGAHKNGGLPQQTSELIPASSRFSGFWLFGLRCRLRCQLSFLLRGELLLDFEADRVHVNLVGGCCIAQYLRRVLPSGSVENSDLNQQSAQRSFPGSPQIGRKQLPDGVAVLRLLDAALTGDNLQTAFVQQYRQP